MTHPYRPSIEEVRARRDELLDAIERTRARVEAADAAMVAAREFKSELQQRTWTRQIEPALGVLRLDGTGRIRDLQLNAQAVRHSDTARLGARILAAIHEAEAEIRAEQENGLAEIFRHVTTD
jgi:DNA-binding protein YbaB